LLIFNVVNMGTFLYAFITVSDAARTGAQYAVMGAASVGSPIAPNSSAVSTLAKADTFSSASVCVNYSGVTASCSFTIPSVPTDPEGGSYVLAAIDVKYTYTPVFNISSFFGMPVTIPSTTIQRRTLMRMVQ
jgi:hypothetical protein